MIGLFIEKNQVNIYSQFIGNAWRKEMVGSSIRKLSKYKMIWSKVGNKQGLKVYCKVGDNPFLYRLLQ